MARLNTERSNEGKKVTEVDRVSVAYFVKYDILMLYEELIVRRLFEISLAGL